MLFYLHAMSALRVPPSLRAALLLCACCLLAGSFAAGSAWAQSSPLATSGSTFTHEYARAGRATITVYVWGAVQAPGTWKVEQEVDLVELLSAIRVPGTGESDPRTKKRTVVRIYRKTAGARALVYETRLDDLLTQDAVYPGLADQDVLQVETITRSRFGWRDISAVTGTISSLLLLAFRLSDL